MFFGGCPFDCYLQPRFDQAHHRGIVHAPCDTLHQFAVWYGIDATAQVGVNSLQQSADAPDRVVRGELRSMGTLFFKRFDRIVLAWGPIPAQHRLVKRSIFVNCIHRVIRPGLCLFSTG